MAKKAILAILLLINLQAKAQGISPELEKRNGFKDIKLLMLVDSVKGAKMKKEFTEKGNVHPSAIYDVDHPDYSTIGEIKVRKIELKTYKNLIYEITVLTDKDPRLMKALESVLGQAAYNSRDVYYYWRSESLMLTYESNGKNEIKMVYKSSTMPAMMKADKEKKIEKIADDF